MSIKRIMTQNINKSWEFIEDKLTYLIEERINYDSFNILPSDEIIVQLDNTEKVKITLQRNCVVAKSSSSRRHYMYDGRKWNAIIDQEIKDIETYLNTNNIKLIYPCDYIFTINNVIYTSRYQQSADKSNYNLFVAKNDVETLGFRFKCKHMNKPK